MDTFTALSKGLQIMLVSAVLLLIDTFFKWQKQCVDTGVGEVCGGYGGWHGFGGVLLGLLTIVAIAWIVVRIVQPELLKSIPLPEGTLALALGGLILLIAVLKNLIDDYSAWPAYVGVVLAAGIAAGAWLFAQEVGYSMPAWGSSTGSPASSAPPPPPPAEPAPPAQEPPPAATAPQETPRPPAPQ